MVRSLVKIAFCQKSTKNLCAFLFLAPVVNRSVASPFGLRRGARRFPGRPEGVSTLCAGDALGMTTSGVLDDEALQLALKDASVKGKLESLAYLDLTEITSEQATRVRAGAPNITELDLRSNNLTDLPDELGDLKALRVIKLDYNKLEHLPAMLTKLPRLTNLKMGGNLLSTVDASVAELRALTDLDLSGNRLITVDPAIARCEKLVYLNGGTTCSPRCHRMAPWRTSACWT